MITISTLRSVPLFSQLRDSDLELLAPLFRPRHYPKNRIVLHSFDPCDAFYIVLAGQVKVMLIAEDGREVVLTLVNTNDFFGESSLMDDEPYLASVVAVEDSDVLVLHRDDFRRCITELPGMAFGLLRALCGRLRESDQKIGGLMLLDVTGRVSNLLLELAARTDGKHIRDVPTHQVIAQMVGASRESVSRTFSTLVGRGYIDTSPDGVRIINSEALESEAGHILRRRPKKTPPAGARVRTTGSQPTVG